MKVLFIGDIYSKSGREVVRNNVPELKKKHDIDLVIANGENTAHGKGMTKKIYDELTEMGIQAFTMGNHFLKNKEIVKWLDSVDNIARPARVKNTIN